MNNINNSDVKNDGVQHRFYGQSEFHSNSRSQPKSIRYSQYNPDAQNHGLQHRSDDSSGYSQNNFDAQNHGVQHRSDNSSRSVRYSQSRTDNQSGFQSNSPSRSIRRTESIRRTQNNFDAQNHGVQHRPDNSSRSIRYSQSRTDSLPGFQSYSPSRSIRRTESIRRTQNNFDDQNHGVQHRPDNSSGSIRYSQSRTDSQPGFQSNSPSRSIRRTESIRRTQDNFDAQNHGVQHRPDNSSGSIRYSQSRTGSQPGFQSNSPSRSIRRTESIRRTQNNFDAQNHGVQHRPDNSSGFIRYSQSRTDSQPGFQSNSPCRSIRRTESIRRTQDNFDAQNHGVQHRPDNSSGSIRYSQSRTGSQPGFQSNSPSRSIRRTESIRRTQNNFDAQNHGVQHRPDNSSGFIRYSQSRTDSQPGFQSNSPCRSIRRTESIRRTQDNFDAQNHGVQHRPDNSSGSIRYSQSRTDSQPGFQSNSPSRSIRRTESIRRTQDNFDAQNHGVQHRPDNSSGSIRYSQSRTDSQPGFQSNSPSRSIRQTESIRRTQNNFDAQNHGVQHRPDNSSGSIRYSQSRTDSQPGFQSNSPSRSIRRTKSIRRTQNNFDAQNHGVQHHPNNSSVSIRYSQSRTDNQPGFQSNSPSRSIRRTKSIRRTQNNFDAQKHGVQHRPDNSSGSIRYSQCRTDNQPGFQSNSRSRSISRSQIESIRHSRSNIDVQNHGVQHHSKIQTGVQPDSIRKIEVQNHSIRIRIL
ncbi:uncharacterized protein LOC120213926 [Hibiscus syriacus]|uniref:uncharacterized protein LOC120213926 n=1 Tax=Hibiscus syriacus TaxID=106335 RepID=UPI001922E575|nr:uncharacterized protein LOC120213926 [Hibiscus syriacus]